MNGIKGLGEAAAASIISEREKNGKYKDIFDFVERVSIPSVKKSGIECLALSGAFDTFSNQISREQFIAPNTKGELFVESLTKYGTQYQQAKMEAQFSLFGMEAIDRHLPPIPVTERWNDLERLNKERELVGIYLSAHPLDEYSVILNGICNLHMEQMNDLAPFENQEVRLGGIVTGLKRQGITKTNQPYGIVMIGLYRFGRNSFVWNRLGSMERVPYAARQSGVYNRKGARTPIQTRSHGVKDWKNRVSGRRKRSTDTEHYHNC